jgi:inorganic phosphate transporter, PiT family
MESTTAIKPEIETLAASVMEQKLSRSPGKIAMIVFGCAIAAGIIYAGLKLGSDLATTHYPTAWPYVLLGVALLIALGFEFVNGFHDTANAVATVIYTHSLEPHVAVVWSGICNLTGVLLSSGAVAFAVVSLGWAC